jgi:hypothetical protein
MLEGTARRRYRPFALAEPHRAAAGSLVQSIRWRSGHSEGIGASCLSYGWPSPTASTCQNIGHAAPCLAAIRGR